MTNGAASVEITRSKVLSAIRRCPDFLPKAEDDDERLLLRAGVMPKTLLYRVFGCSSPTSQRAQAVDKWLEELIIGKRVLASRTYLRAEPRDRLRPIATNYDIEKPTHLPPRSQIRPTLSRRDRLLLWYAAANNELSGSQGDTTAIFFILKFLRIPRIWKAWRIWMRFQRDTTYSGKLPEDAR